MLKSFKVKTAGQGLYEITEAVLAVVEQSECSEGLCTVFIRHTSASLLIQENADPSAKRDLETWLNKLVPEKDPIYTHTAEGSDDMSAHLKAAITNTSLGIPVINSGLVLGTWQGIYLWEHRKAEHVREVMVQVLGGS